MIKGKLKTNIVTRNILDLVHKFPDGNYSFFIEKEGENYFYIIEEVLEENSNRTPNEFKVKLEIVETKENDKPVFKTFVKVDTNIKNILNNLSTEEKTNIIKDVKSIVDDIKAGLPVYNE